MHPPALTNLDDPGPLLTPVAAAALHDRPEDMAWFATPAPSGTGVIARAHTEAHDGGHLLPGHLAAADLAGLHALVLPGLTFYSAARGWAVAGVSRLVVGLISCPKSSRASHSATASRSPTRQHKAPPNHGVTQIPA